MKAKQSQKKWSQVFADEAEFKRFLKLVRDEGIHSISIGDIHIQFQQKTFIIPGELKPDSLPQLSDEERKKEEESILFHSSG